MELDYAELLKHELISLKEQLAMLSVVLPEPAEAMKSQVEKCIDYSFYLTDNTIHNTDRTINA